MGSAEDSSKRCGLPAGSAFTLLACCGLVLVGCPATDPQQVTMDEPTAHPAIGPQTNAPQANEPLAPQANAPQGNEPAAEAEAAEGGADEANGHESEHAALDFDRLGERTFPPGPFTHTALLNALREGRSREFKPVGHTSVVFRMRMDGEHTAAYRPRTRRHRRGHIAEVAAYAVGRLLEFDNVAPAIMRTELRRRISERLHPRYDDAGTWQDLEDSIFYRSPFETPGAAIYWIPELTSSDLDSEERRERWGAWLGEGNVPTGEETLARDLSNMRLFDYLVANWDRFSGGNLKTAGEGGRIVLRDHNGAFAALSTANERRLRRALAQTQKFSRRTVETLGAITAEALVEGGAQLGLVGANALRASELAAFMERVRTARSIVGARIERLGEARVLVFP
ncbi:MAG: hypothetical protein AAF411_16840 [Myxococcota bacterium]